MRHLVWRFPWRKSPCLSIYKTTFHRTEYGRSWAPCIQQIPANGGCAHRVTEGIRERSYWRASGRLEVCHQSVGFGHPKLEDTAFEVEIGELTRGVARSQEVVGPASTRIKPCADGLTKPLQGQQLGSASLWAPRICSLRAPRICSLRAPTFYSLWLPPCDRLRYACASVCKDLADV